MNMLLSLAFAAQIQTATPDYSTIDGIIIDLYGVISGPAGQKRDWEKFKNLFVENAHISSGSINNQGTPRRVALSPQKYIEQSGSFLEEKGFFETEISRKTEVWSSLAHVYSTYESRWKPEDKEPFARGINSIQLWFDGKRWWIESLVWLSEGPKNPLPERYLPPQ